MLIVDLWRPLIRPVPVFHCRLSNCTVATFWGVMGESFLAVGIDPAPSDGGRCVPTLISRVFGAIAAADRCGRDARPDKQSVTGPLIAVIRVKTSWDRGGRAGPARCHAD